MIFLNMFSYNLLNEIVAQICALRDIWQLAVHSDAELSSWMVRIPAHLRTFARHSGMQIKAIITANFLAFSNMANERLRMEKLFVPKVGMVPVVSYNEESIGNFAFQAM